jgi:uncharacterized protein YbjT (DUF2867 family)
VSAPGAPGPAVGDGTPGAAFVAGATGYVGRALVRHLAERARGGGPRPVAHVRADSPRLAEWRATFAAEGAAVDATAWEEGAMAATLARARPAAVFALLGTTRRRGRATGDTYASVDYGLTVLLLRAAQRAAGPGGAAPRFVYLSALGADAGSRSAYAAARGRVERELAASGLPWVVARPSFITGPDRGESRPAERFGAAVVDLALGPVRALGGHRFADRYRSTTAAELAGALVRAAADPAAVGQRLTGDALRG